MLSITCALLALSLPAERLPLLFYTASGVVQLSPDPTRIAFEVVNAEGVARVLAKNPDAQVERLWGNLRVIAGVTRPRLADELQNAGARILTTYRTHTGEMFIADGKIRARFATNLSLAEVQRRVKAAGGVSARPIYTGGYYEVLAPSPNSTLGVALNLHETAAARWAHPDFIYKKVVSLVPDDPLFGQQWHHDLIGSTGAWDLSLGTSDVIIAIIDSGLEMNHPDFAGKIVYPLDAINVNDFDPTPDQFDAHGTGTAGLAAAVGNNAIGVIGVCPGCSIMPIRIMSDSGAGRFGADSDAFRWAADHGAQILSNSWGFVTATTVPQDLDDAIRYAADEARGTAGCL
ncbi:MAG: S8 family serine peptidase, partial [Deltaproteobacteria bacterium]|nr:S8 family serine peptidase [Deltaproteobacteria bacterium]